MDTETTIYITLEAIIAVMSVACNTLVCWVIHKSNKLRQKVMYMFITSLAVADVIVGLLAIPFAILTKLGLPRSSPSLCMVMLTFIIIPIVASIFHFMAISIERYISICKPVLHRGSVTSRRCMAVIFFTWAVSAIIGLLPLMGWNATRRTGHVSTSVMGGQTSNETGNTSWARTMPTKVKSEDCIFVQVIDYDYLFFIVMACYIAPLMVTIVMYSIIFSAVSKMNDSRSSQTTNRGCTPTAIFPANQKLESGSDSSTSKNISSQVTVTTEDQATPTKGQMSSSSSNPKPNRRKEVRVAVILFITVLCFAVCWLPIHVLNAISRFDTGRTVYIPSPVFSVAILLSHANSTFNFFLYSWRLKDFRTQMSRLVLKRFRR